MRSARLSVYGTSLRLTSESPALEALARDFAHFRAPEDGCADVSLELVPSQPPASLPAGSLRLACAKWRAYADGPRRIVRYEGGEAVVYDYAGERGTVYCADAHRLHELGYLVALSRLGRRLDAAGLHRVHALGFEWRGQGGLLLLPSGGGKTTLALELLARTPAGLLSDDSPLLDGRGRLRAFPLRLGLRPDADVSGIPPALVRAFERRYHGPKKLVELDFFKDRVRDDVPLRWLVVGRRGGARAELSASGPLPAARALAANLVVGWGVPQMTEYALRAREALDLAEAGAARAAAALHALSTARLLALELGDSPAAAAQALAGGLS